MRVTHSSVLETASGDVHKKDICSYYEINNFCQINVFLCLSLLQKRTKYIEYIFRCFSRDFDITSRYVCVYIYIYIYI